MEENPFILAAGEVEGQLRRKDLDPLHERDKQALFGETPEGPTPDIAVRRFLSNNPWFGELVKRSPEVSIPKELVEAGGAIDPKTIPGMAELLGQQQQESAPKAPTMDDNPFLIAADEHDNPFFQSGHATGAGSDLAKHRWRKLRQTTTAGKFPLAGAEPQSYENLTGTFTRGDAADNTIKEKLTNRFITPMADELPFEERLKYQQGLISQVQRPPVEGVEVPNPKQPGVDAFDRAVSNIVPSALNFAQAAPMMAAGAATDVKNAVTGESFKFENSAHMAKYFYDVAKTGSKAAVYTALLGATGQGGAPSPLGAYLKQHGVNADEFIDMWAEDPLGVTAIAAGGVGAAFKAPGAIKAAPGYLRDLPGNIKAGIEAQRELRRPQQGPDVSNLTSMTPEKYEYHQDLMKAKSATDAANRPIIGPAEIPAPEYGLTHSEQALVNLRGQLSEKGGKGIHPVTAILAEYQLVRPDLSMRDIKKQFGANREAVLREIADARARRTVEQQSGYPKSDARIKADPNAPGVEAPINTPLGKVQSSRHSDLRRATKTVDEFYKRRKKGTTLGSGMGSLQDMYESLVDRIKARRAARTDKGLLTTPEESATLGEFTAEQMQQLGDALNDAMTSPPDIRVSPEDLAKLKANKAVPGADYVPTPTPEKAAIQYQPLIDRRISFDTQRVHIDYTVREWHDKGMSFNDAHDAVELMKEQGKITGAQESAFYREIQKKYRDPMADAATEPTAIEPETTTADLERQLSEQRQARPPISREPQGFSAGPLASEPKGPTMGSGLGGANDNLGKTWSNLARLVEELPDFTKPESLHNLLTKLGQKKGVPITKNEVQALELEKFARSHKGPVTKESLRSWIADRVVRTEERELGEGLFDKEAYERKLSQYSATTEPNLRSKLKDELGRMEVERDNSKPKFATTDNITLEGGKNYREIVIKSPTTGEPVFKGGHFDPDTIAHMRTTDREVRIGGSHLDTLFSEEFQLDWNKAVRKNTEQAGHPLLSEWKETLFKRLLRKAAEEGKDAVGWTTGKQQADRYNLRKHVEKVSLELLQNGKYRLTGIDKNGSNIVARQLGLAELPDVVGKDVAGRLLEGKSKETLDTTGRTHIEGKDLDFGGNWAIDLYDRQMVDIANKYAKRYGGQVEKGEITTAKAGDFIPMREATNSVLRTAPKNEVVHTLRLNDAMKKSLLEEGNPTFGFLTKEGHAEAVRNLKNIWKNMGRTLGSGPGEHIAQMLELVTKIGLYHIKNGSTDFSAWSDLVQGAANKAGFSIPQQTLHDAWNAEASKNARMPVRPTEALAAAIPNMNVQVGASFEVGQPVVNAAARLLAPLVETGPTSMQAMSMGDQLLSAFHRVWTSDFGTKSGLDTHARKYLPALHDAASAHVGARGLAQTKTITHMNALEAIFEPGKKAGKVSEQYLHDFSDLFSHGRSKVLRNMTAEKVEALKASMEAEYNDAIKDGRIEDAEIIKSKIEELGPARVDLPLMDPVRYQRLIKDPKIQAAVKYWREVVQPEIDAFSKDLGINKSLTDELGLYVKFRQIDEVTAKKMKRTRPVGTYEPQPGELPSGARGGQVRSSSPHMSRVGRSGSAKAATGQLQEGKFYENDIRYMLEHTYMDRLLATTKNQLRAEMERVAVAKRSTMGTKPPPLKVTLGSTFFGKKPVNESVVGVTFEGTNPYNGDVLHVPNTAARLYEHTMGTEHNHAIREAWDKIGGELTAQMILMPAEAVRHGFNAFAAAANVSFFGPKYGLAAEFGEAGLAAMSLGWSKMLTALYKAYNLEGPALSKAVETYAGVNALRLSGFEGLATRQHWTQTAVYKIPGVSKAMHALKDSLFGDPGTTKGIRGMETRLRIVIGETIREMRPELSDAEIGGMLNDAYGTYVSKLQPVMAKIMLPFDPFARAGTGLTRSGYRLLRGHDVSGRYNPMIHMQVAGTLAAIIAYNMALDEDHKAPWEHPEYQTGDVLGFRRNGKYRRFGFSDLSNSLKRGMEFTGLNAVGTALVRGERSPSVLTGEWMRGVYNSFANRASPLVKMISNVTTGRSLSLTPSGDRYRTVRPAMTKSEEGGISLARVKDAAGEAIPVAPKLKHLAEEIAGVESDDGKLLPDNKLYKIGYRLNDIFSVPLITPQIVSKEKVAGRSGDVQHRIQQEYTDTVRSIAREALNFPEERRVQYIMDEIEKRISDEIITELGNPLPAKPAAMKSALSMLFRASMYNTKAEILQYINTDPIEVPSEPKPKAPQPPAAPQAPEIEDEE